MKDLVNKEPLEPHKLNDVILPKTEGFGPRHFLISFSLEKNGYCLRDLGEGTGTFIRVDR